ncbi:hypothetical protein ACFVRE_41385, partial [Streptomyces sp. NPDC057910]
MRAVVRQAVRDVRTAPPPPPAAPPADPAVAALRAVAGGLAANAHRLGELMLEVAPAYLDDRQTAGRLALLCEQIGESVDHGLAARRYGWRPAEWCSRSSRRNPQVAARIALASGPVGAR